MTDTALQAWLDQEDEHVAQTIRKHGLFIQFVSGGLGHPELVVPVRTRRPRSGC
jgi:hypothetical protein